MSSVSKFAFEKMELAGCICIVVLFS
ncbi:hypothetical protein CGLO_13730 [Colletotrichum gloeosporioides Cg-14]|uniref:Uncharacterized protein n=1 Tax=Colletotrichum gloeosporioides (strain Cg-14) TaxID=1237896 RepID=T0LFX4_COLGC|nr:hypothetical protein CGLO_13730 [Colletotrichum gloeosporioides Cg-14]